MLVRPARAGDEDPIAAVFAAARSAAWGGFLPRERLPDLRLSPERIRAAMRAAELGALALVAEDAGGVVGFVIGGPGVESDLDGRTTGRVDLLYTHPDVWGRGHGRALMDAGLADLGRAGARDAVLWTAELNTRPRAVYERYGWRLDGRRRRRSVIGVVITEVRYRIAIPPRAYPRP